MEKTGNEAVKSRGADTSRPPSEARTTSQATTPSDQRHRASDKAARTEGQASAETAADTLKASVDRSVLGGGSPPAANVDVRANAIDGVGVVYGSVNITQQGGAFGPGPSIAWEDELIPVTRLPTPEIAIAPEDVERQTAALHETRLLLVSHAPHRQQEAVAAMRAVLLRLQERHPDRRVFASSLNGALRLESLRKVREWREDRRNALIYLYRSADPSSQTFFDDIEQVQDLIDQLSRMGAHLVLTTALPSAAFRDQTQLASRIALWTFHEIASVRDEKPPAIELKGTFESVIALCAALFPGLGVSEFVALVDTLAPDPAPSPSGAPSTTRGFATRRRPAEPRDTQERWWHGERDLVLNEMGVCLLTPLASEGAEAESTEPGMYFADPNRRVDVPLALYGHQPIFLSRHLVALTTLYLSPRASSRFRAGYRRFLLRLDATSVLRLDADWLLRRFGESLQAEPNFAAARGMTELLIEAPDELHGEPLIVKFVEGIGTILGEQEGKLVAALEAAAPSLGVEEPSNVPDQPAFWWKLAGDPAFSQVVLEVAARQAIAIDLLQGMAIRSPNDVAQTLVTSLKECDAQHMRWLNAAGVNTHDWTPFSLARSVFREMQSTSLTQAPLSWMALAGAVTNLCAPATADASRAPASQQKTVASPLAPSGRQLAFDMFDTLMTFLETLEEGKLSPSARTAVLAISSRPHIGTLAAGLIRLAPPAHWRQGEPADEKHLDVKRGSIDIVPIIRLYKALALIAAANEETPEQTRVRMTELIEPLRRFLKSPQRLELADVMRITIDLFISARDTVPTGYAGREEARHARSEYTRHLQAIQTVKHGLRGSAVVAAT